MGVKSTIKSRISMALQQGSYLSADWAREFRSAKLRGAATFLHAPVYIYFCYRLDRAGYLLLGNPWSFFRLLVFPLFGLIRIFTGANVEIAPQADIGPGMRIFHPSLGLVIHSRVRAGFDLTLFGGNSLGMKRVQDGDALIIGNNVEFGINAVALGPLTIGNNVKIGANGVAVTHAPPDNSIIVQQRRTL